MAEVIEEGKILTFDELRILLFACGIEEINGVFMPEKVFTEEEVLSALHHMAEREIIRAVPVKGCLCTFLGSKARW